MKALDELLSAHPLLTAPGGKDDSGSVVVIGGPPTCPGAVLLTAMAALRTGAGRVAAVVHPEVAALCAAQAWELLVEGWDPSTDLPPSIRERVGRTDVVVIGPGHQDLPVEVVVSVAGATTGTVVLDAGALPAARPLASRSGLVLAPNPAEAAALTEGDGDEAGLAKALVDLTDQPVSVRGEVTVVADRDDQWRFDDAPPGLGTPGSGDVLLGVLAGLLASGNAVTGALGWATTVHATAGWRLAERTPVGYLASDVLAEIPAALAEAQRPGRSARRRRGS
jgi:ADP-dependent NAD(P)H-hydrate dehydratase